MKISFILTNIIFICTYLNILLLITSKFKSYVYLIPSSSPSTILRGHKDRARKSHPRYRLFLRLIYSYFCSPTNSNAVRCIRIVLLIEYVTGIRARTPFSDVILRISRNIAHENRAVSEFVFIHPQWNLCHWFPWFLRASPSKGCIYIYSQHLAPDPRFDKVAIAKSALRRGRLIFVQAGMACDHLAKLAGSGWRDQTGNPTERMDEYEWNVVEKVCRPPSLRSLNFILMGSNDRSGFREN